MALPLRNNHSSFIKEQITDNFDDVLHFFSSLSCKIKFGSRTERGMISLTKQMIPDYDSGTIDKKNEHLLINAQNMLNIFFKETYRDIENVYYKKTYTENDSINYQLILQKRIGGKLRDIDFSLESTGTQALLQQLPFMLVAVNGNVAVIDEFDTGIHDLLVESLLTSIVPSIKGQLILTTHNTILMESALPSDYIYVINELKDGNKEINCVLHYDPKIGERNNRRKQYLFGKYSGVPDNARIDFNKLLNTIKDEEIINQYEISLD